MSSEIYLSDGEPCTVRRLGIFELDNIVPDKHEPFTYEIEDLTGKVHEVPFNIEDYEEPPERPSVDPDTVKKGSPAWFDLYDWQLYQAAIAYRNEQMRSLARYYEEVTYYILDYCVQEEDRNRIVLEEDWARVYTAALVPQLTMDLIQDTLRTTYKASFLEKEIFDAIDLLPKGKGAYNSIRKWENELMIQMELTEAQYALLPLEERARKVCALFLDDIMGSLEMEVRRRELNAKKKSN